MQDTHLNGVDIKVTPFDLTYTGATNKLDLLYYNNINRFGEVLTSLVYNSGIRLVNDTKLIVYNPNKLFLNDAFEISYTLTGTSNRWKNMDLATGNVTNLKDNSADATYTYSKFNKLTDYAVKYGNGEHSYDGWYTFYSVALQTHADTGSGLPIGTLRDKTNVAQYSSATDTWVNLNVVDTTLPIYNITDTSRSEIYKTHNFVSTVKTESLYKKLLSNKLDNSWFKILNILSPKLRTLETAIEFKEYGKAQHMINAINNSLLLLLI